MSRAGRTALIVVACLAVLAVLAGAGYYAWQTWSAVAEQAPSPMTAAVTRGDIEDTVTATGTLLPRDYVDVGTQVSGRLIKLHVDIGATVAAGQLLAEMDPAVYQSKVDADRAQLRSQSAQIADKQVQLALTSLQMARQDNLTSDNATTAEAQQSAEAAQKSARAQLIAVMAQRQQTEAALRGDTANLGYTKIHAPMAGTVVSLSAKQGETLNANQQTPIIMRIADLSTMTVQAQVAQADVGKLSVGMDVHFTPLGSERRPVHGKLRQISPTPTVANQIVYYDALLDVPNPDRTLMTQMTAQVVFVASSAKAAVLVPLAALRPATAEDRARLARGDIGGDPRSLFASRDAFVSVLGDDGKAAIREVKVGLMNCVAAQITHGLEPGEVLVIGTRPTNAPAAACGSLAPIGAAPAAHP